MGLSATAQALAVGETASAQTLVVDAPGTVYLVVGTTATTAETLYLLPVTAESAGERKTYELELIMGVPPLPENIYLPLIQRGAGGYTSQAMPAQPFAVALLPLFLKP